ncbi:MAG: ABC transporter substrate-binding protein [Bacillaceae bacterium]
MKKFVGVFLAVMMLFVFVGCSNSNETSGKKGLKKVKVGYMPNYASLNSVVAGIKTDSFKEEGIEVELVEFADGPTIIAAMESGSIDVGYIGPGAHVLPIKGKADIIAFSHLGNADEVIANKDKGINTIQDLKGKTVAVASGTSSETILDLTLAEVGLSKNDIKVMDMDASAIVTAMISGSVDAVATWSPNTNSIKNELGDKAIMLSNNERYANEFPSIASWVTAPGYAEKNADTVEKFLKGLFKGYDYRVDKADEVAKWVAKEIALDEKSLLEQTGDGDWLKASEIKTMIEDGTIKKYYEKQQENFVNAKKLTNEELQPVEKYVLFDLMKKAIN